MHINGLIQEAVACEQMSPRFAFVAPFLIEAKRIAWDYLRRFADPIPDREFHEAELYCSLPGDKRISLYGADNADSIQGIYLDGVVMDEYQHTNPDVFRRIIRPMLADRHGWVIYSGKPLGKNHFYELYDRLSADPAALVRLYRGSETGYIDEPELALMRQDMGEDLYQQEVECSWEAAIQGAYYTRQLEEARRRGRITQVDYEPAHPVSTAWDIGWSDATAVICYQQIGRELRLIDYLEESNRDLAWWVKTLRERGYAYQRHHLPHDAADEQLAAGGLSIERQLLRLGLRPITIVPKRDVQPGIHQARLLFPRMWFDREKCKRLIDALGSYHEKWDRQAKRTTGEPDHDWASHGADAFRYLAISLRDPETRASHGGGPGPQAYAETRWPRWGDYGRVSPDERRARGSLS